MAADSPLLRMDNVLLTPHAAHFSSPAVAQIPRRCGEEVADDSNALTPYRDLGVERVTLVTPRRLGDALPFLDRTAALNPDLA